MFQQHFASALSMRQHRNQIGHGAAGHVGAGFLAGALGGKGLDHRGAVLLDRLRALEAGAKPGDDDGGIGYTAEIQSARVDLFCVAGSATDAGIVVAVETAR